MPTWLQERPSSSKSEDTNAFHPRRPYKWWNAKQMRDTQRVLFGIIYDEKVQRGRWRFPRNVGSRAHKLQKTVRFIAAGTDEEISIASGFWGMTIPFMVWAESPWEMDPKKYRPALPPWLIPLNKSESSNQPNAFHPEIYLIGRNSEYEVIS